MLKTPEISLIYIYIYIYSFLLLLPLSSLCSSLCTTTHISSSYQYSLEDIIINDARTVPHMKFTLAKKLPVSTVSQDINSQVLITVVNQYIEIHE